MQLFVWRHAWHFFFTFFSAMHGAMHEVHSNSGEMSVISTNTVVTELFNYLCTKINEDVDQDERTNKNIEGC